MLNEAELDPYFDAIRHEAFRLEALPAYALAVESAGLSAGAAPGVAAPPAAVGPAGRGKQPVRPGPHYDLEQDLLELAGLRKLQTRLEATVAGAAETAETAETDRGFGAALATLRKVQAQITAISRRLSPAHSDAGPALPEGADAGRRSQALRPVAGRGGEAPPPAAAPPRAGVTGLARLPVFSGTVYRGLRAPGSWRCPRGSTG